MMKAWQNAQQNESEDEDEHKSMEQEPAAPLMALMEDEASSHSPPAASPRLVTAPAPAEEEKQHELPAQLDINHMQQD